VESGLSGRLLLEDFMSILAAIRREQKKVCQTAATLSPAETMNSIPFQDVGRMSPVEHDFSGMIAVKVNLHHASILTWLH
jgi:hypothetical protein